MRKFACTLMSMLLVTPALSGAEPMRTTMQRARGAFTALHLMSSKPNAFATESERRAAEASLETLENVFRSIRGHGTSPDRARELDARISLMTDLLEDANRALADGAVSYARIRVREVADRCMGCHAAFRPGHGAGEGAAAPRFGSARDAAPYLLATRQFARAESALEEAVRETEGASRARFLRQWLSTYIRNHLEKDRNVAGFARLRARVKLSPNELSLLDAWEGNLAQIYADPRRSDVEVLIEEAEGRRYAAETAVSGIWAATVLQGALDADRIRERQRPKTLLAIGHIMHELREYFDAELPQTYFRSVIAAYPGSTDAREAFRRYEAIERERSRSRADAAFIDLELAELRRRAFGVPEVP